MGARRWAKRAAAALSLTASVATATDTTHADASVTAPADVPATPRAELLWEIDPYYSDFALHVPIDDRPVPDGGALRETEIYRGLFRESLRPRVLLLEASVYPLPVLGSWIKRNHRDTYDGAVIGDLGGNELNVIEGITAGFQEPWAVSAFVGGEMTFSRAGDARRRSNHGYMGYLVSAGTQHIRANTLIDDNWWEFEWKLKGERDFRDEKLSWSFRVGTKNHGNPYIRDGIYLGLRRSNIDFVAPLLSFLTNSSFECMTEFDRRSGEFLRQEIIVGKKLPVRRWRLALTLETGVIIEQDAKYRGPLADPAIDDFTLVFRPNIDW